MRVSLPSPNLTEAEKTIRTEVFWEVLEPYSITVVEKAISRATRELSFFPAPAGIIDFIEEEIGYPPSLPLLTWEDQLPTEEGRKKARELLRSLNERWKREDEENERKRVIEFEKSRQRLLKQKKLFGGGGE